MTPRTVRHCKSGRWNDWVSMIIANLLVGISYGWWQREHTATTPTRTRKEPTPTSPSRRSR